MCVSVVWEGNPYLWTLHYSHVATQISLNRCEPGLAFKSLSMHIIWSSSWDSSLELSIPGHMIYSSYFPWHATGKLTSINNIDEPFIVTLSPWILSDSYLFTWKMQQKPLCHMNVIPAYGRPAVIPFVKSIDDSEKEFTSIPSLDGTARSLWGELCFLQSYQVIMFH